MKKIMFIFSLAAAVTLLMAGYLYADVTTSGGTQTGRKVQHTFRIHQNRFPQANDLHFKLWQKENNININGWQVGISDFNQASSQRATRKPTDPASDTLHAVDVEASGATIDSCDTVRVDVAFWLTAWNTLRLKDIKWTTDIDSVKPCPDFGWTVGYPEDMGGGMFNHRITIYNDDADSVLNVRDIKFLATFDTILFVDTLTGDTLPINIPFDIFVGDAPP